MADTPVATADTTSGANAPQTAQPSGAGTAVGNGVQASGSTKVDLEALLSSTEAQELIERKFVKPAISKVEFNRQQLKESLRQELAQEDYSRQVSALRQQAESSDPNTRNAALVRLGEMGLQQSRTQSAANQRAELQMALVRDLAQQAFGVDVSSIPQDALASNEALGKWLVRNSPISQAEFTTMSQVAKEQAGTVQQANEAAQFASRLSTTPVASEGSNPSAPASTPAPLMQEEFDRNRGDIQWRRKNLQRMRDAIDAGTISR